MTTAARHRDDGDRIPGQRFGYWYSEDEKIPDRPPPYHPTGAVLPKLDAAGRREDAYLDLVNIDDFWAPLSEAGSFTYSHTAGLLRGERWFFVSWDGGDREVLEAGLAAPLDPAEVETEYGELAAERARRDVPAIRLTLSTT